MGRMKDKYMEYLEKVEAEAEALRSDGQFFPDVILDAAKNIVTNPVTKRDHDIRDLLKLFNLDSDESMIQQLVSDFN